MPRRLKGLYRGCSVNVHRGKLRLRWRDQTGEQHNYPTNDPATALHRQQWQRVADLVGQLLTNGDDPLPHLLKHHPPAAPPALTARHTAGGQTYRAFYTEVMAA